jgi:hypothetical protein
MARAIILMDPDYISREKHTFQSRRFLCHCGSRIRPLTLILFPRALLFSIFA